MKVTLVADDGPPKRAVADIVAGQREDSDLDLKQVHRQIPLRPNGELDLEEIRRWKHEDHVDVLIVVTEMPRRSGKEPSISSIHGDENLAIISMPALGVVRMKSRLKDIIVNSIDILARGEVTPEIESTIRPYSIRRGQGKDHASVTISAPRWTPGRLLLVLGMVVMNEPLKALPQLTGAFAAAAATGAFGVFYSTTWEMADVLPAWRLAVITLAVITVVSAWLIINNGLWDRGTRSGSLTEVAMYNTSVIVTLILSLSLLYLTLFIGILIAGLIVIQAGYLSETIGSEVGLSNYIDIAWLATSMGTAAGALGSNFDDEADVRRLTNGRREELRIEEEENEDDDRVRNDRGSGQRPFAD